MNIKSSKYLKENYKLFNNTGATADIYQDKDNYLLLKIFRTRKDEYDKDKWNKLSDLKTNYFAFPIDIIYIRNVIKGYTMYKKDGLIFDELDIDILIKDFIDALKKLEYDLRIISENNIKILDLHTGNILYDSIEKAINIIDSDEYGHLCIYNDLYVYNVRTIANLILKFINIPLYNKENINSIKELVNYIIYQINILEEIYKIDIKSISDIKSLKKIKL